MDLMIVGASARAAAQSAIRAGFRPLAIDRFGDEDLESICPTCYVDSFPRGLIQASRKFTVPAWMYTGGLENVPRVIKAISDRIPLLGNDPQVVRRVRDPWHLAAALAVGRFRSPEIKRELQPPRTADPGIESTPCQWLCKPFRSGGGGGINFATPNGRINKRSNREPTHYYQQFVSGRSLGVVFTAATRRAVLLGISAQLVGSSWAGAASFLYVGSIGPVTVEATVQQQLEQIGNCLAEQFTLTGLFGIDVILCDGEVWTIELNPRYTASVEILERAFGFHAIRIHHDACTTHRLPTKIQSNSKRLFGKAVIYAHDTFQVSPSFSSWLRGLNAMEDWPVVADIPKTGSQIDQGHPICTVFGQGATIESAESALKNLAARVHLETRV